MSRMLSAATLAILIATLLIVGAQPILVSAQSEVEQWEPVVAEVPQADEHLWSNELDRYLTHDEELLLLSQYAPQFAGFYVDEESETLRLLVTETINTAALRGFQDKISTRLNMPWVQAWRVEPVEARFTWQELYVWKERLFHHALPDGWVFIGISVQDNLIEIGVRDPTAIATRLDAQAAEHGVPQSAISVVKAEPLRLAQTILDHLHVLTGNLITDSPNGASQPTVRHTWRPFIGGLQVQSQHSATCTIGMIARLDGHIGFTTASHCSADPWFDDNVWKLEWWGNFDGSTRGSRVLFGQASRLQNLGLGARDGMWFTGPGCPTTLNGFNVDGCRWADIQWIRVENPSLVSSDLGKIAWPPQHGSIAWDGESVRRIIGGRNPQVHELVAMVGRSSGRQNGHVRRACYHIEVSFSRFHPDAEHPHDFRAVLLCQALADYASQGGDSGAPVFRRDSGDVLDAAIRGTHVGVTLYQNEWLAVFSPWTHLRSDRELGTSLMVCAPGRGC